MEGKCFIFKIQINVIFIIFCKKILKDHCYKLLRQVCTRTKGVVAIAYRFNQRLQPPILVVFSGIYRLILIRNSVRLCVSPYWSNEWKALKESFEWLNWNILKKPCTHAIDNQCGKPNLICVCKIDWLQKINIGGLMNIHESFCFLGSVWSMWGPA